MKTVCVIYHHEPDGWWAESPDIEGWSAAADTYGDVHRVAEEGVRFALDDDSVHVDHDVPAGPHVPA